MQQHIAKLLTGQGHGTLPPWCGQVCMRLQAGGLFTAFSYGRG